MCGGEVDVREERAHLLPHAGKQRLVAHVGRGDAVNIGEAEVRFRRLDEKRDLFGDLHIFDENDSDRAGAVLAVISRFKINGYESVEHDILPLC